MRKTLFTLAVDNYAPAITELTFPLFRSYAEKINADFFVITDRKFPEAPPVYEKLQIYTLGRGNDWNIFADADALIHPDLFDVTDHLAKDTVLHHGSDMAGNRWKYDQYFRRDGRHIGACNWWTVASDWCLDLWHPLEDLSFKRAIENIYPLTVERECGIEPSHLIDDYVLSRNIARFCLKFTTFKELSKTLKRESDVFFRHDYMVSTEEKVPLLSQQIEAWKLNSIYKNLPKTLLASSLKGWMSNVELYWLAQQAQKHTNIVEIGSYHGRSTRALADNTKGIVHAIDTWRGSEEHQGLPDNVNAYLQFSINMQDLMQGPQHKVRPLVMDSQEAAFHFNGDKFDMIFIDASHDYKNVKADILAWKPHLADRGIICGHDYGAVVANFCDASKFGVTKAVNELLPHVKRGPGSLWYAEG
jgi:hypothetical protein